MSSSDPVRNLIPLQRISDARIRALIAGDPGLSRWSRCAPGALRPSRLAALVRDRIWEGHDVSLAAVRERLAGCPDGRLVYQVTIEIDVGGRYLKMLSRTRFVATPRGMVRADIELTVGNRTDRINGSSILLRSTAA